MELNSSRSAFVRINTGEKIEVINADEDITLVDVETNEEVVAMDVESQEKIKQEEVNAASKGVSATEPTVFDDEEVTMTMVQTLIKLKVEKPKLLDEQIAQKLHDEAVQKVAARDKQEKADLESALKLQKQYDDKEENIDWSAVVEQNMLEIVLVSEFKVKALQVKYPSIDWEIHIKVPSEDKEKALWVELKRLFEPDTNDVLWKLQRYIHAPLTWKLYTNCGVHHVSLTIRHDIFMLTEKDYRLSNVVMILMLSGKLQVEEDSEMARDLVMKIFIEANKPKSRSLDTSSK
nr:hypothetical protein [Tanacetum cinerariifolium]